MKKIVTFVTTTSILLFAPLVMHAQAYFGGRFKDFFQAFTDFINNILVPLVFALAFIVFIWGIFQYFILGGADEGKREEGRKLMLWGIIGFVLMVSIWGIVNLIAGGLGLDGGFESDLFPKAPGPR